MRVNVYAEEMTDRIQIISKEIEGQRFTGLRLYLELPATVNGQQYQGPFMHHPGDDDSSAVTFWGKRDLRNVLRKMICVLDTHYGQPTDDIAGILSAAPPTADRMPDVVKDAIAYSRNFANSNPQLSGTTATHIHGLCNLLQRAYSEKQ